MTTTLRSGHRITHALLIGIAVAMLGACSTTVVREPSASSSTRKPPQAKPGATVRVQRGDTLYGIAFRNGVDVNDVMYRGDAPGMVDGRFASWIYRDASGQMVVDKLTDIEDTRLLETVPIVDRIACALYEAKDDQLKTFINSTRKGQAIASWTLLGFIQPQDEVAGEQEWDRQLLGVAPRVNKIGGHYMGIPVNVHRLNWMWVNPAVLEKAGVKGVPKTWDEFFAAADKVKKAGLIPVAHGGQNWQDFTTFESVVLGVGGAKFYQDALVKLDPKALTSPTMTKSLETFRKIKSYTDPAAPGRDWNLATAMVIQEKAAFQFMGDWAKGEFTAAGKVPGKDFICTDAPGTQNAFTFNIDSLAMFQQKNPAAVQAQAKLAATVMKATIERSGVDPKAINYVTVGNTIPTESRFAYVARVASIQAGLPMDSVAMSVNRLCSSGLQGIVTTAQNILLGDCDYGIGGGVEVMSRGAYLSTAMRSGARMGDTKLIDTMVATLTDPFGVGHMGITAENLVTKWGITREEQDALAVDSHRKAAAAGRRRSRRCRRRSPMKPPSSRTSNAGCWPSMRPARWVRNSPFPAR